MAANVGRRMQTSASFIDYFVPVGGAAPSIAIRRAGHEVGRRVRRCTASPGVRPFDDLDALVERRPATRARSPALPSSGTNTLRMPANVTSAFSATIGTFVSSPTVISAIGERADRQREVGFGTAISTSCVRVRGSTSGLERA